MRSPLDAIIEFARRRGRRAIQLGSDVSALRAVMVDEYIRANLYGNPRYQDPKRLNRHEYQVYSQNGEDGIIEEIFARIGTTNRVFVEIGVQDGLECNTTYLLLKGWSGHWIEANAKDAAAIRQKFSTPLENQQLKLEQVRVTAENVESTLREAGAPSQFDFLSIDIDGNDYWVWKSMERFSPRVVAIEYNALFGSSVRWVMKYKPSHVWDGSSYFNASLSSLGRLGESKGYCLVGCNFHGVNAFFVRRDVVGGLFCEPFTADNHYEPIRYHLQQKHGFRRDFGDYESI
ncbi:MAG: hypothetical protein EPO20_09500 [Betaproteobacteria bacterium]|nr:MAG: hypothetical protein EPO20_09500 [Betaproteobacteria bacterium]